MRSLSFITILTLALTSCAEHNSILIADFEGENYGKWTAEGNAFDLGPMDETMGFHGNSHASSLNYKDEPATGTLTSPFFIIEKSSIHFLIGGRELDFVNGNMDKPDDLSIQLLVDNKVVRSQTPDEFHAMFHRGWDVSEFVGKEAQIRIVDRDNRRDAFIDIDRIVLNDLPPEGIVTEKILHVSEAMLNIPVKHGAPRYLFEVFDGHRKVREFDVELAADEIDNWVVTDVHPWLNKEITIRTSQYFENNPTLLDRITTADHILESEDLYQEKYRPQFHFTAKRGWINDPNGLVYYDGEFHLCYQANPFGWDNSRNDYNKTWGHAVSSDLIHWEEMPAVVNPDHLGSIYSGSAVVDHTNSTGFQTGKEKPIVAVYSSAGTRNRWSLGKEFTQSLAYSNDRGRTFTPFTDNPVQENIGYINRDPKAIWHAESKKWVIVLYLDHGAFVFFTSNDLKNWEQQSILNIKDLNIHEVAAFEDCPELFELPVDGDQKNSKWILYAGSGDYVLGDFDGHKFLPESDLITYNYGDCFYASQTFNNMPEHDPRRIQMAWGTISLPGMPFNQMMTFPVELSLKNTEEGIRMYAYPVMEIKHLYQDNQEFKDLSLEKGEKLLEDVSHRLLDVDMVFEIDEHAELSLVINGREIIYSTKENLLYSGEERAILKPEDGKIHLRILIDCISAEIFANHGRIYMPLQALPEEDCAPCVVWVKEGSIKILSLQIRKLGSIYENQ